MSLDVQLPGKASPCMVMRDRSFVASGLPPQSAKCVRPEAENWSGRSEQSHPSAMVSCPEAQNYSGPGSPNESVLDGDLYQVHLPDWYPRYTACMRHFLDKAQYSASVQSLAAYINIRLPCQQLSNPVSRFEACSASSSDGMAPAQVSLRHYIRRLVVTGNDTPSILGAFFGRDWESGVGAIRQQERMNYLFTAKSSGWASTKAAYDILPDEHTPFLRPIQNTTEEELSMADNCWSEWLAMEDWMVGPRSP